MEGQTEDESEAAMIEELHPRGDAQEDDAQEQPEADEAAQAAHAAVPEPPDAEMAPPRDGGAPMAEQAAREVGSSLNSCID